MRKTFLTVVVLAVTTALLTLSATVAMAVHDEGLFELGRDAAPGSADILGDSGQPGPDWADIFDGNYNVVNLNAGLAARFLVDDVGKTDRTTFASRNKNSDPISTWRWGSGSVASKGDLTNAYAYATTSGDDLVIYAGLERVDPGGDTHADIELNQALIEPLSCARPPCGFSGQRTVNDVLLVMDYTKGGALGVVEVRVWDGAAWSLIQPTIGGEGCNASDTACGFNNGSLIDGGPWPNYRLAGRDISPTDQLGTNAFTELGLNVTQLLGTTPCFRTVQAKTRSSSSFDSTLLDFEMASIDLCKTKISIEPLSDANQINQPHTFTAKVESLPSRDGFVWGPVDQANVSFAASGVGSLSSNSCVTSASGTCTVDLASAATGLTTVSATTLVPGTTLAQTTDGVRDNSPPATKRWVDAMLTLDQGQPADQVRDGHIITATLRFDYGDGNGFIPASPAESVNFSLSGGPGGFGADPANIGSAATCLPVNGTCTVTLQSTQTGTSTVSAGWSGVIPTAEGNASGIAAAQPLTTRWTDAVLNLESDAGIGQIGEPITLTATLRFDYGDGQLVASGDGAGQTVTFSIVDGPGSLNGNGQQATCQTGADGTCAVTFSSDTPGTTTVKATWSGNISVQVVILGSAQGTITQQSLETRLTLEPSATANQVGTGNDITARLEYNAGGGFLPIATTRPVTFTLLGQGGFGGDPTSTTTSTTCPPDAAGACTVTLQSTQTGTSTVSAGWSGDITGYGPATFAATSTLVTRWVDAELTLSPAVGARQIRSPHDILASLKFDYGDGRGLVATTQPISISFTTADDRSSSGFGGDLNSITPSTTCMPDAAGNCTVTLQSTQTGTSTVSAAWAGDLVTGEGPAAVTVSAEALNRWLDVRLSVGNAGACTPAEAQAYEVNDFVEEAYGIGAGTPYRACVASEEEFDVYSLQISTPSVFTVTLNGVQSDLDLAVFTLINPTEEIFFSTSEVDATGRASAGRASAGRASAGRASAGRASAALVGGAFSLGAVDERAVAIAGEPGTYYVLVYRPPDVPTAAGPYTLQVEVEGIDTANCVWTPPYPPGSTPALYTGTSVSGAPTTLILTHQGRLEATYGAARAAAFLSRLHSLADDPSVKGVVVPVEADAAVAAAYTDWNASYCSVRAADRVAAEIRNLIQQQYPNVTYVVIAGSDEIVPFYRQPDPVQIANEREYAASSQTGNSSPLFWALAQGYVLTQDYYVDQDPYLWLGRQLYIPDKAIGRLVETPEQMTNVIDNFLAPATLGTTPVSNCLVTGYDFLSDSAQTIQNTLEIFGVSPSSITTLNDASWTAADLFEAWSLATVKPDLVSVNAHFEHWNAIPAAGDALFTNADITGYGDFANTVAYSMGCHAGLNVPDGSVLPSAPQTSPDLPQAFAQQSAAAWVANTGFGYGMTETVADSEQLMLLFTQELGRSQDVPIGQALLEAKRRFVQDTGAEGFGVYEEKSLNEATLYGLPMHKVSMPSPVSLGGQSTQGTSSGQPNAAGSVTVTPAAPFSLSSLTGIPVTVNLDAMQHATRQGTYYTIGDGVYFVPGLPLQPSATVEVQPVPGYSPRGVLLISADYRDTPESDPVVAVPSPVDALPEPHLSVVGWLSDKFWELAPPIAGRPAGLVLTGGQYNTDGLRERRYSQMVLETYYAPDSSSAASNLPPVYILDVHSEVVGGVVNFSVRVDSGGAGVQRVLVTYDVPNGDGTGSWRSLDLASSDGSLWSMSAFGLSPETEYFVQVLNNAGEVAVDTNRGLYYSLGGTRVADPVGIDHQFVVQLEIDYGDGTYVPAPDYTKGFTLTVTGGSIASETCNSTGTLGGKCDVFVSPTSSAGTSTVDTTLVANWLGAIDVTVAGAGGSQLVVVPAAVSANQDSAATEWWLGSISLFKNAQVSSLTPSPEICFTLTRTDGGALVATSAAQQCFTFSAASPTYLFRWEGLEAGTYAVTERVPQAYTPLASSTDTLLFTNIVVDDANRNWLLRTLENVPANEGCSPGYWRNHLANSPLDPTASFNRTFDVTYPPFDDSLTLEQAVNKTAGGFNKLARHGAAAVMSVKSGIHYPYTYDEVVSMIQSGLSDDATPGEPEATQLANANNLGCPLN